MQNLQAATKEGLSPRLGRRGKLDNDIAQRKGVLPSISV